MANIALHCISDPTISLHCTVWVLGGDLGIGIHTNGMPYMAQRRKKQFEVHSDVVEKQIEKKVLLELLQ